MKCPYLKITKAYAEYAETDSFGKPIQFVEENYNECVKEECPFYCVRHVELPINPNMSFHTNCARIVIGGVAHDKG